MTTEEGSFTLPDGVELYTKTWHAAGGDEKARLIFIHGFSDHINFYGKFFPTLAAQGITSYALDQRGWGRSVKIAADKGRCGTTKQVMDDMTAFIKHLPPANGVPTFLMGHSMGGGQVLYYTATGPSDVLSTLRGTLANAPFIAIHPKSRPIPGLETAGRLAAKILPNMQMVQKLDPALTSRDPEVVEALRKDELCHDTGTLAGLAGMLDRARELDSGSVAIGEGKHQGGKTRLWVSHGTADGICHYDAAKHFVERTKVADKEFKSYEGWYHKLHDEPGSDKERYANDVAIWIKARL